MDIESLRSFCLSLPHVTEAIKWGNDLVFMVAGKMFCVASIDDGPFRVSFKCTEEDFATLTDRPGFIPAPYMARNKWVQVLDMQALSPAEWTHHLQLARELVFQKLPKKLQAELLAG